MEKVIESFRTSFESLYLDIIDLMPNLLVSLFVLVVGIIIIRSLRSVVVNRLVSRSKDPVGARFLADILIFIFFVILVFIIFRTLGLSALTQTIIGAAGITTFIIGFALKDIGENFLAGIVMIFDRPFEMGDLIEIEGRIGRVIRISIRETTIKTVDGKDVYIPNADIIKKHFINYTIDDQLRESFDISINNSNDLRKVIEVLYEAVVSVPNLLTTKKPSVTIKNFDGGTVQLSITYWYSLLGAQRRNALLKNEVMLAVIEKMKEDSIGFPNDVQDINIFKKD